jgi:hypothetical protein
MKIIVLQITRILDHSGWVQKSCYGMLFSLATVSNFRPQNINFEAYYFKKNPKAYF